MYLYLGPSFRRSWWNGAHNWYVFFRKFAFEDKKFTDEVDAMKGDDDDRPRQQSHESHESRADNGYKPPKIPDVPAAKAKQDNASSGNFWKIGIIYLKYGEFIFCRIEVRISTCMWCRLWQYQNYGQLSWRPPWKREKSRFWVNIFTDNFAIIEVGTWISNILSWNFEMLMDYFAHIYYS